MTTELAVFSDPASVAVVGASDDPTKWGYWLASGALRGAHRRRISLVNSRSSSVLGHPCATSVATLDHTPDLVALCVPAGHVDAVVEESLDRGVRGFLGITAGVADDAALARRISSRGARLIGTNSLGIYDATTELQLMWGSPTPGPLAVVSQSGQLGSELSAVGRRRGLGVSRFVSIGNQSDVTAIELLDDLATHDATRVVALYLESFTDGEALFDTLGRLRAAGKPTVLLTVGASAASSRLARTHTGSLTSSLDVVDAACRAAGVIRVDTPSDVVDVARTLLAAPMPRGRRVAVVGDSGGQSAVAADVAAAAGLSVPPFPAAFTDDLAADLPAGAACGNPVDLAGAGERDLQNYACVVERVIAHGDVDAVVMTGYFGCYGEDTPSLVDAEHAVAKRLGAAVSATGVPVLVHTMSPGSATSTVLQECGIPVFDRVESAVRALASIGGAATPLRPAAVRTTTSNAPVAPGYWAARAVLTAAGVTFPPAVLVRTAADLSAATRDLRSPYVLKAGWLEHKSDVGGVRVNLHDPEQLSAAFDDMWARLGEGDYVVEEQDTRGDIVEILVAGRRDPQLGAVVVVGAGGTDTEIHRDVRMECAPVSLTTARAMIESLRCAPLLHGWRGRPPVDVAGLAELVVAVSHLLAQRGDLDEIELNPVRVTAGGVLAVDALIMGDNAS